MEYRVLLAGGVVFASTLFVSGSVLGSDAIGVVRNGNWFLDLNDNNQWDGPSSPDPDARFGFGLAVAVPVTGDWNGDGTDDVGVFQNGTWFLDLNGNDQWDGIGGPDPDARFGFGAPTATPVAGDWDGDGTDDVGVFLNGTWFLDLNGNDQWDGPGTDARFGFGVPAAKPVTGDWDGNGTDDIGVFHNGTWFLDLNGNHQWDGIGGDEPDARFSFGLPTDTPVTGDWNGDGTDDAGVFNNGTWFVDLNGNDQWDGLGGPDPDGRFSFGLPPDDPIAGRWNTVDIPKGCGDPESGNCDEPNGSPFCNDAECCAIICAADPFCCNIEWDSLCAESAPLLCEDKGLPFVIGIFNGSGSQTLTGCLDPETNGTYKFPVTVEIYQQTGANFIGFYSLDLVIDGFFFEEFGDFTGMVNGQGQMSGSGSYTDYIDGVFDAAGDFDFTGSISLDTITLDTDSQDTEGDTCSGTGTFTVTR